MIRTVSPACLNDLLYGADDFLSAQVAFLQRYLGPRADRVLDVGCGTGRHVAALSRLGHRVVGVDLSPAMLNVARTKVIGPPRLCCADMRALPMAGGFQAALCLESPLALLPGDDDLAAALRRVVLPGGWIIADVYDYLGALGTPDGRWQRAHLNCPGGRLHVRERHHYDRQTALWRMRQEFSAHLGQLTLRAAAEHTLRIRSVDTYTAMFEATDLQIEATFVAYPDAPPQPGERRMIIVARRT